MSMIRRNRLFSLPVPLMVMLLFMVSCWRQPAVVDKTAAEILGDPACQAISFGGYRGITRDIQPTLPQLKEDMKILSAMGIKLLRTYNVHHAEAATRGAARDVAV
ncbi:MAG TPA: hypothetical protein PLX49_06350, partial [Prolixibacteraceae bacterium]|nr:hypothetical protein [Prolixibacteraceae bacterium]